MREEFEVEEAAVYEQPVLAEAGDYAEVTNGFRGYVPDGIGGLRDT